MIFAVITIGTGYLNQPNWLLADYSVYHRVAWHASQPTMFMTCQRSRRSGRRGLFFFACQLSTPNETGSFRGVQYCNRVWIWKFLVRYIVTGCISCAPSGLWQGLVFNPQRHPPPPPVHFKVECTPGVVSRASCYSCVFSKTTRQEEFSVISDEKHFKPTLHAKFGNHVRQ